MVVTVLTTNSIYIDNMQVVVCSESYNILCIIIVFGFDFGFKQYNLI